MVSLGFSYALPSPPPMLCKKNPRGPRTPPIAEGGVSTESLFGRHPPLGFWGSPGASWESCKVLRFCRFVGFKVLRFLGFKVFRF